ncbi:DUF2934 domain-containing protein [Candidatus Thiodictyon syntrophicum]|jgi:hypothetical protein|uniref:DUF2934 domain-containing protein n=1 Tax=Candidatus Thiodictyon syntrophicum TaxID=1166950 RepID=A0A2K8UAF9_9GAMM|nr:DUF2934 domain-containing protein [Candidatus Thiodictyon syntrophicum]AUB82562.1 hypothetical protein THSYN_17500 [Candidatus Thiodictyon syntrophicum]
MGSLQMVERTPRRRGNSGHVPLRTIQEPHAASQRPPMDELLPVISQAAYFRAQRRGFAPGHEVDDWIAAEQEVIAWHHSAGAAARV